MSCSPARIRRARSAIASGWSPDGLERGLDRERGDPALQVGHRTRHATTVREVALPPCEADRNAGPRGRGGHRGVAHRSWDRSRRADRASARSRVGPRCRAVPAGGGPVGRLGRAVRRRRPRDGQSRPDRVRAGARAGRQRPRTGARHDPVAARGGRACRASPAPPYPLGRPMHYTSGTTGQPKGVWAGVLPAGDAADLWGRRDRLRWGITAADVTLVHGPLAHSRAPAVRPVRPAGRRGRPAARAVRRPADRRRPRAGAAHHGLRRPQPPPATAAARRAAAAVPLPPPRARRGRLPLGPQGGRARLRPGPSGSGSSTAPPRGSSAPCAGIDWAAHPGSVGRARPDRELRIVDGTIWCRPPASGRFEYWRDPGEDHGARGARSTGTSGSRWATSAGSTTTATSTSTAGGPTS